MIKEKLEGSSGVDGFMSCYSCGNLLVKLERKLRTQRTFPWGLHELVLELQEWMFYHSFVAKSGCCGATEVNGSIV